MSSARANAAARSRRAGGAENSVSSINTNRPGQQGQPGQKGQQAQIPQGPVKLSVSDAIALITLRLGRVENIVQVIRNDPVSTDDSNVSVDEAVFTNIVNRIEQLENYILAPSENTQTVENTTNNYDEDINTLKEVIISLQNELVEVKTSLSKLQMFTMETNQKLISAVFNNTQSVSAPSTFLEHPISLKGAVQLELESLDDEESTGISAN